MQADNPAAPTSQQGFDISLIDVLREVPTILEELPPVALKTLSTTCKSLRSSFCARVNVITLSEPADACKIRCNTWPHLMMLVCTFDFELDSDSEQSAFELTYWQHSACLTFLPALPGEWECMMEVQVQAGWDSPTAAVLIRPCQQAFAPMMNLSRQHCAVLSGFADKYRNDAESITLHGPLVTCQAFQSLLHSDWPSVASLKVYIAPQLGSDSISSLSGCVDCLTTFHVMYTSIDAAALFQKCSNWSELKCVMFYDNQLDAHTISAIKHANMTDLQQFYLRNNMLGKIGIQHLVSCTWPLLEELALEHAGIEGPDLRCLVNSQWPALREFSLDGNHIEAEGVSYLVQGRWPCLKLLVLSDQGLDAEAYLLLGIARAGRVGSSGGWYHCSDLPQFSKLEVLCMM